MSRLIPTAKFLVRALIEADAMAGQDDYERFAALFDATARRWGLDHAWRLEAVAPWVNARRDQRAEQASVVPAHCQRRWGVPVPTPGPGLEVLTKRQRTRAPRRTGR